MFKKLMLTAMAAGLLLVPLPALASSALDTGAITIEQTGQGEEITLLDKEKPSKPKKEEKEEKKKKKFDDFKDANGNGIDDRYEKKEPPKRGKKEKPEEVNF